MELLNPHTLALAGDVSRIDGARSRPHSSIAPADKRLQGQYDKSIGNIEANIFALAAAITALDGIEAKLIEIRASIERIISQGRPLDWKRIDTALETLATYLNETVRRLDTRDVNLLRDSRLEIRFAELSGTGDRQMAVSLTMISLDKLLAYKTRQSGPDPLAVVDQLMAITQHNTQILSSVIIALFAARDYTCDVAQLVLDGGLAGAASGPRDLAAHAGEPAIPPPEPRLEAASGAPAGKPQSSPTLLGLLSRLRSSVSRE